MGPGKTGVCSTPNLELVKSLGAETVIDYTAEDYSKGSERYDLILDAVPLFVAKNNSFMKKARSALAPGGKFISINNGSPRPNMDDLVLLKDLVESGKYKPVIDKSYP